MSIQDEIRKLESQQKLHRYQLGHAGRLKRRLFFTDEIGVELNDPMSRLSLFGSKGKVFARMTLWVKGDKIYAKDNGKPGFLKRLDPPPGEIWEMRLTEPEVQVRLFGRFAYEDTIVLTHIHLRGDLGNRNSKKWKRAMIACEASWHKLFPQRGPFKGNTIHDYVTESCDDFEI